MGGLSFLWISWAIWIFVTFFMKKQSPYRTKLAAALLGMIICSSFHFPIGGLDIYAGGLFALLFCYHLLAVEKKRTIIYFFICSYIVTAAYSALHLFEIYDPVLIIFNKDWMMAIILAYIVLILQKTLKGRLILLVSGTMQGEILLAIVVDKLSFNYPVGSFDYLDICAISSALILGWSFLENARIIFETHLIVNQSEKQKSS